ncbi:hypothetical protein ACRAWC_07765 [Leifsonia sp. L25]
MPSSHTPTTSPYAYAATDKVKGFHVTPLGNYHVEDIYKTK